MEPQTLNKWTVEEHAAHLREGIRAEILYAISGKRDGWLQRLISPLADIPARHFGSIAAGFYEQLNREGINQGAQSALGKFKHAIIARNAERIPKQGPLILVANHPGGLDSLGILSCLPRNDLKVLVTDVKFLRLLDYCRRYLIYVDFQVTGGMLALRDAINHLEAGGALLIFAHGEVEPEPESYPGAGDEINNWSPSLEIMLRKIPITQFQILTISGAVQSRFLRNPITLLRRQPARRQKLAEFLQVIQTTLFPHAQQVRMHLTIGKPKNFANSTDRRWMPEIISDAKLQMKDHLQWVKSITPKV